MAKRATSKSTIPTAKAATGENYGVNAYDSATTSGARSGFVAFPTNSRQEITSYTRREIIRKSRAAESNIPALTRIVRKFARHAVGSGINFRVLTEDEKFNSDCQRDVEEWWNNPGMYSIDGSVDGWEAKRLAAETIMIDGEFNAAFVRSSGGLPMIQPLDVFEIETPGAIGYGAIAEGWDDGVKVNQFERPIAFAVKTLPKYGKKDIAHVEIPAQDFLHIGRRRRVRGHRFLPWAYSGLNKGIDALDLGSLITGTAKLHSALAVQVKKTAKRGQKGAVGAISKLGADESASDTAALEKVYGSMINYVGENGEIDLKSSNHPGSDLVAFYKLLLAELAIGFDCSPTVMLSLGDIGGTEYRGQMEDAQSSCDLLYDQITWRFVRREVIWKISNGIKAGRIRAPKDPYWFSTLVFRGPKKLTVDLGRMANAFKTLTRNAGMSIPRFLDEQGLDAYAEISDNIKYLKRVREMCDQHGVPVEWVYEPTPGAQNNITVNQPEP
jgi:capsid protein